MTATNRILSVLTAMAVVAVAMPLAAWALVPDPSTTLLAVLAGCAALVVVGAVVAAAVLRGSLAAPLASLRAYARAVAEGHPKPVARGAFTAETADLRDAVAAMAEALAQGEAKAARRADQAQGDTAAARRELEAEKKSSAQLRQLASSMQRAAGQARGISRKVAEAARDLSRETDTVHQGMEVQKDRMTETATAMEQMMATVMEVARNASDAASNAAQSREKARTGAEGVHSAVASIQRIEQRIMGLKETMTGLGDEAQAIGAVITVINDIADQTNLLALNAAIEAARAGEAGRGFAVVADEVRKLAEKTMTATKEVNAAISAIQDKARENVAAVESAAEDIASSTRAADESGRFMEQIVDIVAQTSAQVESIATASEEQSAASEQINRAVSEVTRIATETAEGMERSAGALAEMSGLIGEMDAIVQGMAALGDGHGQAAPAAAALGNGNGELVRWTNDLSVKVGRLDDQHKRLIALINELHAAMRDRKARDILLDVVDRLKDYTVHHFAAEEKLFDAHGYPDAEAHKKLHRGFVEKVAEFEAGLKAGKLSVTMDVMEFLKDWLIKHIKGVDRRYSAFLNEHGER